MTAQVDDASLISAPHHMSQFSEPETGSTAAMSRKEVFYRYFQDEATEIQAQISQLEHRAIVGGERQDAIDHTLAAISNLSDETGNAAEYLPAYDQRTYTQAIKALSESLAATRQKIAPRKKFSFRPEPLVKNSSAISLNDAAELAQSQLLQPPRHPHGPESSAESSATGTPAFLKTPPGERNDAVGDLPIFPNTEGAKDKNYNLEMSSARAGGPIRKPSFSQASTVGISGHTGLHIVLPSSAAHATSSGALTQLSRCIVDMSVPTTSTTGAAFAGLTLLKIQGSLIIAGQVSGAAHITSVSSSIIVVAARQVRMHNCQDVDVYLLCPSRPIIEDCKNIKFAPLPGCYEHSLDQGMQEAENKFDQVDDFKWLKSEHSPNWSILPDESRLPNKVWTDVVPGGGGLGLDDIFKAVGINKQ